jgi:hypothetical protein
MDVARILVELRQELLRVEEAIQSLERLAKIRASDPGRHPSWNSPVPRRRGRPPGSKNKVKREPVTNG